MRIAFTQHTTLLDSDLETPVGLFIRLVGDGRGILLESAEADGRWGRHSVIATDFLLSASCDRGLLDLRAADERLAPLRALSGMPFIQGLRALMQSLHIESPAGTGQGPQPPQGLPPITRALYGYLGYGVAGLLEPKLARILPAEEAEACFVLPGTLIVFDHSFNRITRISLRPDGKEAVPLSAAGAGAGSCALPRSAREHPLAGKENYIAAATRLKECIRQGEIIQAVLSTPFSAPLAESPFSLYRRLRRLNPSPYMFYMRLPGPENGVLLGSSPEVLVGCEAGSLRLCPIAGTRPRSRSLAEDALFGDELMQDPKEKAEHVMLVDLGRNDLGRVAAPGSVKLERFMELERFSHVMHLTSRIKADLAPGLDGLNVLAAAFPAGTVSGAPKIRAMELVALEEQSPRGPYAGAIGWLGLDKEAVHLDFGITIRSLWVREGQVRWQAGAGIVHDSVPELEWLECLAKAEVIRKAVLGEDAAD